MDKPSKTIFITVSCTLGAILTTIVGLKIYSFLEILLFILDFILILLTFALSNSFQIVKTFKKYFVSMCILIPLLVILRVPITNEIPKYVERNIMELNSPNIKIQDFTTNKFYADYLAKAHNCVIIKRTDNNENNMELISLLAINNKINLNILDNFITILLIIVGMLYFIYFATFISSRITLNLEQKK